MEQLEKIFYNPKQGYSHARELFQKAKQSGSKSIFVKKLEGAQTRIKEVETFPIICSRNYFGFFSFGSTQSKMRTPDRQAIAAQDAFDKMWPQLKEIVMSSLPCNCQTEVLSFFFSESCLSPPFPFLLFSIQFFFLRETQAITKEPFTSQCLIFASNLQRVTKWSLLLHSSNPHPSPHNSP